MPTSAPETRTARVQEAFIAEIQKNGILHALEWIGAWYQKAAAAHLEDELSRQLGGHARDRELVALALTDMLLSDGSLVANYSSGPGENLMRQATVAEVSRRLREITAHQRSQQLDAIHARLTAAAKPQAEAGAAA
ncbi:hypothetical protein [Paucibacter soli]|uniref:hypothetical protein n=1 Tax=Paucibacter soli TaxID=3133433 RepID=UPI0030A81E82